MKLSEYKENLEGNQEYQQALEELDLKFAFGDAVLEARLKKDWTQSELARQVGTQQANISRIEAGLSNPTLYLVKRICDTLDIKVQFVHDVDIELFNLHKFEREKLSVSKIDSKIEQTF